jgi:imidazolonepropionase
LLSLRGPKTPRRGPELGDLGIISDGAILIRDGVIEEVGPTRRLENLAGARGAAEINAAGRVVMPGFVDSHTHIISPMQSGTEGDAEARAVFAATTQRLEVRARARLEALTRHGATTVEVKTGVGPDESCELKLLRVLAAFKRGPLEVVPTFLLRVPPESENPEWILTDLLPKIRRRRLARFADLVWDANPSRQEFFGRYLSTARSLGFGCKVHACHDFPGAAAFAVEHRAATVDHVEDPTPAEANLLAGASTIATVLPGVPFHDGGRDASGRALVDAGVALAVASGYNARHRPALNMQTAVSLACMQKGLTAAEAISAGTINGAHALSCAERVGSLEPGKSADLLILDTSDYRDLANQVGLNLVYMTMKRGECIYEQAEVSPRPVEDVRLSW